MGKGYLGKVRRWRCKSSKGQSERSPPDTEKLRRLDVIYNRITAFLTANLLFVPPAPAKCVRARSLRGAKEINQSNRRFSSILAASWRAVECLSVKGEWLCGWQETGSDNGRRVGSMQISIQ